MIIKTLLQRASLFTLGCGVLHAVAWGAGHEWVWVRRPDLMVQITIVLCGGTAVVLLGELGRKR